MKTELKQICPRCGNEIDPDVCWCGDYIKNHPQDHSPIPMGCKCGYDRRDELNAAAQEFMEGMASNEKEQG